MQHLAGPFFLQMAVILLACWLVGMAAKKMGQPQVVGEMIAGVLLGPSLLGLFWPEVATGIFTKETRGILYTGAQLGVGFYMFIVGMEFRTDLFRSRVKSAMSVSLAGMIVPFILGGLLAPWLLTIPGMFAVTTKVSEASLFLGAAIAITAFPMLARIIYERKMAGTPLGTLALAAGAIDDAVAWCVLAIVVASFNHAGAEKPLYAILGGILYAGFMLTAGKSILKFLDKMTVKAGEVTTTVMAVALIFFCCCAWLTDMIGIHTVFGGFILGICMPRGAVTAGLIKKLEPFTLVFLLPMFFTYSGLNTNMNVFLSPKILLVAVVVLLASILGKGVACWGAARLTGENNRTSMAVGALMNSRGLMELIIINIGYEKGIIGKDLFAVLVLMAIVTTLLATPVFEYVYGKHVSRE